MVTRLFSGSRYKRSMNPSEWSTIEWLVVLAVIGYLVVVLLIPATVSTCGPRRAAIRDLQDILHYRTQGVSDADIQKYIEAKGKSLCQRYLPSKESRFPPFGFSGLSNAFTLVNGVMDDGEIGRLCSIIQIHSERFANHSL